MIEEQTTSKTILPELSRELLHLPFEQVAPSETNPRLSVEREPFEELKKSIFANGLLQPIVVRPRGDVYEIIGGHRRFQALRELAQEHPKDKRFARVSAVAVDVEDAAVPVLQLAENLNRSDLSAAEIADAVARAVASGVKAAQLAESLGWTKRNLNRYLQLANSPEWFRDYAREVKVPKKKVDDAGEVVLDPKTKKPVIEVYKYPGLQFTDLTELLALYNLMRESDALQLEELGGEQFRPQAEKTTKRLAFACATEGWSKRRLREEIARAKDPRPRGNSGNDEARDERPPIVITADRCVIDLRQAGKLSTAGRGDLAAALTRALAGFGFKTLLIAP